MVTIAPFDDDEDAIRSANDTDSGIGREGGTFSREFFTEPKAVVMEV
jgi:acyl-CoA reductase-like NAD-dependent aldehyde dehydrogenase